MMDRAKGIRWFVRSEILMGLILVMGHPNAWAQDDQGDRQRLLGRWSGTVGALRDVPVTLVFRGEEVTYRIGPVPDGVLLRGRVVLDTEAVPKQIDLVTLITADGKPQSPLRGIYRFEEDDQGRRLVLQTGANSQARPLFFDPKAPGYLVLKFEENQSRSLGLR